jgi:hypothetical protein
VFGRADVGDALSARARVAAAAHPRAGALRRQYEAWLDEDPDRREAEATWSEFAERTTQAERWVEVGGPRSYLTVTLGDGGEACGDAFSDQVALLFEVVGDALVVQDDPGFVGPLALMDLDRDGHLEAVTAGGTRLETRGPHAGLARDYEVPWIGCPC